MSEVVNTLSTKIKLDVDNSSLYDLRQELMRTNREWKNSMDTAKIAGNDYEAASSKVRREEDALKLLRQQLELEQSELKNVTGTTKADLQARQDWENKIRNTNIEIAKHTNFLEKAENSEKLFKNGVLQSKDAMQESNSVFSSRAEKLRAEGKALEADKTQLEGNRKALVNLTDMQKGQMAVLSENKVKVDSLKETYVNMQSALKRMRDAGMENSESYKHQATETERLKNQLDKATSAYNKQEVQLNKTGKEIAETKAKNDELDNSIKKVDGTPFEKLKAKVSEANQAGEKNSSVFKDVLNANLATKVISFGWQEITTHIGGALAAGMEYDKEQQKMVATWQTLTGSVNKAHGMVDTVNQLSVATGQSAEQVDELEQGFYHLNSNKKESDAMTHSMLNMSDAVGLSGQQIQAVTQDMVNGLSRGKANAGMLNQISQYFPMFREQLAEYETKLQKTGDTATKTGQASTKEVAAQNKKMVNLFESMHYGSKNSLEDLQKYQQQGIISGTQFQTFSGQLAKGQKVSNAEIKQAIRVNANYAASAAKGAEGVSKSSKVTVADLGEMAKQGKISAKDIENVFEELGNKKYDKAADNMLSTMVGAERVIKARVPALIGDVEKPLMEAKNPIFLAVSKWVADPKTDKEFTKVGKAATKGLSTITAAFTKAFDPKSMGSGMDKMMDKLADSITKISNSIASHSKDITEFFKNFKSSSVNTIKLFAGVFKDLAVVAIPTLGFMAENSNVFAPLIASMIALNKIMVPLRMTTMLMAGAQTALNIAMEANPAGLFIGVMIATGVALGVLYNKFKPFREYVNGFAKGIEKFFNKIGNWFGNLGKITSQTFGSMVKDTQKQFSKIGKFISDVFKGVVNFFKSNWKQIGLIIINPFIGIPAMLYKNVKPFHDFVNSVLNIIKVGFGAVGNFFVGFWNLIKNIFNTSINFVVKIWSAGWNTASNIGKSIWNGIASFFGGFWNGIKSLFNSSLNFVTSLWTNSWNTVSNIGKSIWNGITSFIGGFWNGIKSVFNSSLNWVSNIWDKGWTGIFDFGKGIWNGIKNTISGFWDFIKNIWNSSIGFIVDKWKGAWDTITSVISGAVKAVHHAMVDIARGVLKPINEMLKGLKDGINWVLDKVGADKISAKWEISMPGYAKGTGDTHPGGLAKVNDGATANFREMYQLPSGQVGMFPNERNMVVNLPKGTSVLDGERSAILAKSMSIPAYKDGIGGMIDSVTDTVTGAFKGLWDKGADIVDMADDIIKKPAEFLSTVFKKFVGIKDSKISFANDVITKFPSTVAKEGMKWVKKLFEDAQENGGGAFGDAGGGRGAPGGGGAARWHDQIKAALAANGASTDEAMIQKWIRQINTESGGNEKARQPGSDPDHDGSGPALGLVQTKASTFKANAFPGHGDLWNGYDDLLSGIRYAIKKYGKGMGFIGNGHGYANGGFVNQHQIAEIAENNKPEMIIPMSPESRPRGIQLMSEVISQFAKDDPSLVKGNQAPQNAETSNDVKEMNSKFDQLLNLIAITNGLSKEQINAIYETAQSPQERYKQDAQKNSIHDYQFGGSY